MAEDKSMRLNLVARKLNVGLSTVVSKLAAKGHKVDGNPNTKINAEQLDLLSKEFRVDASLFNDAPRPAEKPAESVAPAGPRRDDDSLPRYFRDEPKRDVAPAPVAKAPEAPRASEPERAPTSQFSGPKVVGRIDLNPPKPVEPRQTAPAPQAPGNRSAGAVAPTPQAAPQSQDNQSASAAAPQPKPQPAAQAPAAEPRQAEPVRPVQPQAAPTQPAPVAKVPEPTKPDVAPTPVAKAPESNRPEAPRPAEARQVAPAPQAPGNRSAGAVAPQPKPQLAQPAPAAKEAPDAARPEAAAPQPAPEAPVETIRAEGRVQLQGLTVKGTVDLSQFNRPTGGGNRDRDGRRKRIRPGSGPQGQGGQPGQPQARDNNQRPGDRSGQPNTRPAGDRTGAPQSRDNNAPRTGDRPQQPATGGAPGGQGQNRGPGGGNNQNRGGGGRGGNNNNNRSRPGDRREAPTQREVQDSIRATQARIQGGGGNRNTRGAADRRRDRRQQREEDRRMRSEQEELESKTLKVTEFVSANDLSSLMDVSINEVISVCLNLGMFVSINQRLDAEAITVIADEFGYDVQFVSAEEEVEAGVDDGIVDSEDDLVPRAPIVTIMGHVDHGKTSLLDYIRRTKVASGEAGGITQHIGAYSVTTTDNRMITFLDTPGHEAFTAMRARGAKVTDVAIIVIAADDSVMPQTREAINHAQVAGVPIVFAFSKVDKPGADAENIRRELSEMNMLVEEWGGKYQTQEISSKSGMGIDELLEKVLVESDLLELKANPDRRSAGSVIEAQLDKGRGYVSTVLVQTGTLRQGDIMLVGAHYGRVRAMTNDRGERIKEAGPSTPVQILGLPGAPQAGDKFNVMETEREAREIANKREQLLREQTLRTRKHITLEEIGRRKAIGTFKELNVIVKGDVDGSVEALSDSLLQLSTAEVQVNIIHKAVGQVSESDVLLASASDAVIVGFQVRPSASARKLAEQEQIEIRLYSIIYDAINEVKDAMEGLLAPTTEEVITGTIDVREVFKITKVGTVAGCMVTDGLIKRSHKIRVIRDFIVVHTGEIDALKRFKDDVGEVRQGYECGLSVKNFNDLQIGDTIEAFEIKEVKRTL